MRVRTTIAIVVAVTATAITTAFAAVEPLAFLRGSPLVGPVHLRLIVAGTPPYVLDVDSGAVKRYPVARRSVWGVEVFPFRRGALATVHPHDGPTTSLFLTASGSHRRATAPEARSARKVSRRFAVARAAGGQLVFVDRRSWRRRRVPWKSILGYLEGPLVQPHGPYVAIGFADPAYPGPQQAEDVFLLNRRTGTLTHVPGFPAQIRLKFSSMAWADDGRLVMLLSDDRGTRIGTYRPGDRSVALRHIELPAGSDGGQFVPIVSAR